MNKMVIGGVNNQVFVASNLGRIEHFYSVLLGLPLVKRTVHHLDPRLPVITFGFQAFEGEPKRRHTISYVEWNPIFYMMPEAGFVDRNVGHRAAHSFEEVSCVDWPNTLRDEAATKRKRQPEIVRQLAI